jgi:hypothetical protein
MVGRRHRPVTPASNKSHRDDSQRRLSNGNGNAIYKDDLEAAHPAEALGRFRNIAWQGLRDKRKGDLKKQLLEGIDHDFMQQYRKSKQDVSASCPPRSITVNESHISYTPGMNPICSPGVQAERYLVERHQGQEDPKIL